MAIEIRPELLQRLQARAAQPDCTTEEEVIEKALDALDWLDQKQRAVQAGDTAAADEIDRRFAQKHGVSPPPPRGDVSRRSRRLSFKQFTILQIMMVTAYVAVLIAFLKRLDTFLNPGPLQFPPEPAPFPWLFLLFLVIWLAAWLLVCFRLWQRQTRGEDRAR